MTSIFWMLIGFAAGAVSSGILCVLALRAAALTPPAVRPGDRSDSEYWREPDPGPRAAERLREPEARDALERSGGRVVAFEHQRLRA